MTSSSSSTTASSSACWPDAALARPEDCAAGAAGAAFVATAGADTSGAAAAHALPLVRPEPRGPVRHGAPPTRPDATGSTTDRSALRGVASTGAQQVARPHLLLRGWTGAERDGAGWRRQRPLCPRVEPSRHRAHRPARRGPQRAAALRRRHAHAAIGREPGRGAATRAHHRVPRRPDEAALRRLAPVHHEHCHARCRGRARGFGRRAGQRGGRLVWHAHGA